MTEPDPSASQGTTPPPSIDDYPVVMVEPDPWISELIERNDNGNDVKHG
jgi:hypothetical protein